MNAAHLHLAVGIFIGVLAGFFVGAFAVQARLIWPHRRTRALPRHSLRGGMLYLPPRNGVEP